MDAQTFESLLAQLYTEARRRYQRIVKDDIEDLWQDSCVDAWRSLKRFQAGTDFTRWFFRIMHRNFIDLVRRKQCFIDRSTTYLADLQHADGSIKDVADPGPSPEELCVGGDIRPDEIRVALALLPQDWQQMFWLYTVEDLSYEDLAAQFKIPIGTVRSRLFRIRQRIRDTISPLT